MKDHKFDDTGKPFLPVSGLNYFAVVVAIVYSLGFVIYTIYTRTFGSVNISIIKANFIFIGTVFMVITLSLSIIPLVFHVILTVRKKYYDKKDEKTKVNLQFNRFNTFLLSFVTMTYLLLFIMYSTLFTREDINKINSHLIFLSNIKLTTFYIYFFLAMLIMALSSLIEERYKIIIRRSNKNIGNQFLKKFFVVLITVSPVILRLSVSLFALIIIYSFYTIDWISKLLKVSSLYFSVIIVFTILTWRYRVAEKKIKKNGSKKDLKILNRVRIVLYTFFLILFYLAAYSYSLSIFRFIPKSKGGMMPLYKTIFYIKDDTYKKNIPKNILSRDNSKTIKLYILFSDDKYYYVSPLYTFSFNKTRIFTVYALKKNMVVILKRIRCNPLYSGHRI